MMLFDELNNYENARNESSKKFKFHTDPNIPVESLQKYISIKMNLEDFKKTPEDIQLYLYDRSNVIVLYLFKISKL